MSLKLPDQDSPVRELFDIADLAVFGNPTNRINPGTGFLEVLRASRNFMACTPAAKSVHAFAFRANGDLWLIEVTRKTWRKIWSFGQ